MRGTDAMQENLFTVATQRFGLNMCGSRQKPALHSIYRIAAAFGCSGSALLAQLEAMAPGCKRSGGK